MEKIQIPDVVNLGENKVALIEPNKISFKAMDEISDLVKRDLDVNLPIVEKKEVLGLTLVPCYDCNLRCIYCYSKGGERKDLLKKELVKGVIDYFGKDHKRIHLRFAGGGEPFLNFEIMKYAVEYSKEKFGDVSLHTITNGTFNDEQFQWLVDHNSFVRISFDSLAQKIQRMFETGEDSTDVVANNIKRIIKAGLPLAVQMMVTSKSILMVEEMVRYLYNLGVKDIKFEPVYISKASRGEAGLMVNPEDFVEKFVNVVKLIKDNNWDVLIDTSFFSRPTIGFYCSMPEGNKILTPEGYITSCVEISKENEPHANELFYAKWDVEKNGLVIDKGKLQKLSKYHFLNSSECTNCDYRLICRGGCPMRNFWTMENGMSQHMYACTISKLLIPKILKLVSKDKDYSKIIFADFDLKNEKTC